MSPTPRYWSPEPRAPQTTLMAMSFRGTCSMGSPQFRKLSVLKVSSPVLKQGSTVQSELSWNSLHSPG